MRVKTAVCVAGCAFAEIAARAASAGAMCSSLNGPFCAYFGYENARAPLYARQNLAGDDQEMKTLETDKSVKIQHVLKEFATQATADGSTDEASAVARDPLAEVEGGLMLFEKIMGETLYTMLLGMDDDESSRASDGVIELLESLDGDALKGVFVIALDVLVAEATATLSEKAPTATDNVRVTAQELKEVKGYATYTLSKLTATQIEGIRYKFDSRPFAMMQVAFQLLVIAGDARGRLLAIETTILVLQLAQEAATKAKRLSGNDVADAGATRAVV
ncbi:unnamed protein product [Hyaloperonospora brassicae]|uniref:RxLR effector candidate protein n=1 Tax=Hyaloperonospora brassicae TaxID=162125 RepID=A0AAV0TIR8_HYABA|nr:unnamed protein product [Hyaloperonospora brassicae]